MMRADVDPVLEAVSYPYPMDRKRRKLRVAVVTGMYTMWSLTRQKTSYRKLTV